MIQFNSPPPSCHLIFQRLKAVINDSRLSTYLKTELREEENSGSSVECVTFPPDRNTTYCVTGTLGDTFLYICRPCQQLQ